MKTISSDFFKELKFWNSLSGNSAEANYLVYGGDQLQQRKYGKVFGWKHLPKLIRQIPE